MPRLATTEPIALITINKRILTRTPANEETTWLVSRAWPGLIPIAPLGSTANISRAETKVTTIRPTPSRNTTRPMTVPVVSRLLADNVVLRRVARYGDEVRGRATTIYRTAIIGRLRLWPPCQKNHLLPKLRLLTKEKPVVLPRTTGPRTQSDHACGIRMVSIWPQGPIRHTQSLF